MNALLANLNATINENYILPKSCVLLLLRFSPTEIIQAEEASCKERDFTTSVYFLSTSTYDQWVKWDDKKVEVCTKKVSKQPQPSNVTRAAPEFIHDIAAPCHMNI